MTSASPNRRAPRYRIIALAAVFTSGAVALIFQVVWQRYLAFLVGSEARSISLVVAVFLLGLAAGYGFWGQATARSSSRRELVRWTGYAELAIGAWAAAFPFLFGLLRTSTGALPDWLALDLALTAALLFFPTFLMGASIPLLTAALPDTMDEVHYCHSRIYGINTLGAFAGAFLGGLVLIPALGLRGSLFLGVLLNLLVALAFIANPLPGRPQQPEEIPVVPNRFGTTGILAFVFVTGSVSIAFEVLMMRVLSLAVGSGQYVFPVVVGAVILGLGIGSLSLRRRGMGGTRVAVEVLAGAALLVVVAATVPYWAYWLSHVRVSLTSIPSNYDVFIVAVAAFVTLVLVPVYLLFGRMLPMGYALLRKDRHDYGARCGRIYLCNTLGTVFGSVILGHLLLDLLGLEIVVRLNIAILLGLGAFLLGRERGPRWAVAAAAPLVLLAVLPSWRLEQAAPNLFRDRSVQSYHFQGFLAAPRIRDASQILFHRDDSNLSVVVYQQETAVTGPDGRPVVARSIAVNHKTDGSTLHDYSNMVLSGTIPYFYAPGRGDLRALVVGLGTGMTSGVAGAARDIGKVVTVEISPSVLQALPLFDRHTFFLSRNPKSALVQADAFRYLARGGEEFDLIISEPSNPWVAGIENLFTPEYYTLVRRRLAADGVFFQWVQSYETTPEVLAGVVRNFVDQFPHARLFAISGIDIGLLGSATPLWPGNLTRRLAEPDIQTALEPIGATDAARLELLAQLDARALRGIAASLHRDRHDMEFPWLGRTADRARFVGSEVDFLGPLPGSVVRDAIADPWRAEALLRVVAEFPSARGHLCGDYVQEHSAGLLCALFSTLSAQYLHLAEGPVSLPTTAPWLAARGALRDRGLTPPNLPALRQVELGIRRQALAATPQQVQEAVTALVAELGAEGQWDWARAVVAEYADTGVLAPPVARALRSGLEHQQTLFRLTDAPGRRSPHALGGLRSQEQTVIEDIRGTAGSR